MIKQMKNGLQHTELYYISEVHVICVAVFSEITLSGFDNTSHGRSIETCITNEKVNRHRIL